MCTARPESMSLWSTVGQLLQLMFSKILKNKYVGIEDICLIFFLFKSGHLDLLPQKGCFLERNLLTLHDLMLSDSLLELDVGHRI